MRAERQQHVRRAGHQHPGLAVRFAADGHIFIERVERQLADQLLLTHFYAPFRRQHFQRAFGRPADNAPAPCRILLDLAFVADIDGGEKARHDRILRCDKPAVRRLRDNLAHRLVAVAADAPAAFRQHHRFYRHLVHGEGAGFVGADHRHGAQGFDRRQLADNRVFARHRLHAQRKNNRDNCRQAFRHRRHCQTDHRQRQRGQRNVAQQITKDKESGHHQQDRRENRFAELIDLQQQRRFGGFDVAHHFVDMTQLGVAAGSDRHAQCGAGTDGGAGESKIESVAQRFVTFERLAAFRHHGRFASQDSFFHAQVVHFEQPQIRRNTIARPQHHHVARHEGFARHRHNLAAAHHHRFVREHILNALQRLLGVALLNKADERVDYRHAENNKGIDPVAHDCRNHRRRQQDIDQHIVEVGQKLQPGRLRLLLRQRVGAVFRQPRLRFVDR